MSDTNAPRWELLPHDPERFFELPDEYDLGDLKRSYNRLVRRFKPEKSPAEFQRIRAAYEDLEGALRYRVSLRVPSRRDPATPDRTSHRAEEPSVPSDATTSSAPPAELAPHETYARLRDQSSKSPGDYLTLALLSDVVHPSPVTDESFFDWLLAGLSAFPSDASMMSVVRQYLAEIRQPQEIVAVLLRAVDVLPPTHVRYLTEPAWDRLLYEAPFDEFRDCLDRCSARRGWALDHGQVAFSIHILRVAIWKADQEFLDSLVGQIEDHYFGLDHYAQQEFETLMVLRQYVEHRHEFIARGRCCFRIDRAIQDWCVLSEPAGDLSVLDCQYYLSGHFRALCDEFPAEASAPKVAIDVWEWIIADVLLRLNEAPPTDGDELTNHVQTFLIRQSARRSRTMRRTLGNLVWLAAVALLLAFPMVGILFVIRSFIHFYHQRWSVGFIDWLYALGMLVCGGIGALSVGVAAEWLGRFSYPDMRYELSTLFRVVPISVSEMADAIARLEGVEYGEGVEQKIEGTRALADSLREDTALRLFTLSQICLRAADPESPC